MPFMSMPLTGQLINHQNNRNYREYSSPIMMTDKPDENIPTEEQAQNTDWLFWGIWMGLVFVTVLALPFVVRHSEMMRSLADMCLSVIPGLSR